MATLSFSIAPEVFDINLLPENARQVGTSEFREAVNAFLTEAFKDFGGTATIKVDDRAISVIWNADSPKPNPMAAIVEKLQQGKQAEGIQLLELLLSNRPDDPVVLYNLGLALSDAGRLERAEQCLRQAAELDPRNVNILAALGVALGRMDKAEEAISVLSAAVRQDDRNPWAHRSLGTMLLRTGKTGEAISHFEKAARLLPKDQLAWLGLADAYRLAGRTKEAESTYLTAVNINPHSELAEKARAGSNLLAQSGFENTRKVVVRQDAVNYCLDAMKRFANMPQQELQNLTLEMAMAGREGFAVHDPSRRYTIKALSGDFSGLAMVCFLYVAMQRIAPGTNIGFDLAEEYAQAQRIFSASA